MVDLRVHINMRNLVVYFSLLLSNVDGPCVRTGGVLLAAAVAHSKQRRCTLLYSTTKGGVYPPGSKASCAHAANLAPGGETTTAVYKDSLSLYTLQIPISTWPDATYRNATIGLCTTPSQGRSDAPHTVPYNAIQCVSIFKSVIDYITSG